MKLKALGFGAACVVAGILGFGCSKQQPEAAAPSSSGPIASNQGSTQGSQNPQTAPPVGQTPAVPKTGQPDSAKGTKPGANPTNPAPEAPNKTPSVPSDSASPSEKQIVKKIEERAKGIQSPFAPNPVAAEGWKKSSIKAAELGKRVDQAVASLKGVYGESSLYVKNKELEGNNSAKFKIKDRTTYAIQYQLPDTPTVTNRLIADGKKKVVLEDGKWLPQQTEDSSLTAFKGNFTKKIFSPLTASSHEWSSVLSDLSNGKSGYTTVIEEKQMSASGRTFSYIRVVAKKGNESTLEARFDAKRFVPLTIRLTQKDKTGFETQYQWQAKWSFDNQFPATEFQIAKNPS